MYFSKETILEKIKEESIKISPFDEKCLDPVSYELHLGSELYRVKPGNGDTFDGANPKEKELVPIKISKDGYILNPGEFIIAKTVENISCDDSVMGIFDGKASLAQIGLFSNVSSVLIEPGMDSKITCEVYNCSEFSVCLRVGQKIGQIFFTGVG